MDTHTPPPPPLRLLQTPRRAPVAGPRHAPPPQAWWQRWLGWGPAR